MNGDSTVLKNLNDVWFQYKTEHFFTASQAVKIRGNMEERDFTEVYESLRQLLHLHRETLNFPKDSEIGITAETKPTSGKAEFFAAAEIKKNYVSFHLMPIYCFPDLAAAISPDLKKRMQGKSCFNFKKPEPELFTELAEHIKTGIKRYRLEGKL